VCDYSEQSSCGFSVHRLLRSPNAHLRLELERWHLLLHFQLCTVSCVKH
jgi:hypothetical protein